MDLHSANCFVPLRDPLPAGDGFKQLSERVFFGIKKGLDNTHKILERLGRPDRNYPIVLIGGTNGKGSTGSILAHACRASGLKVGWTTSPHLRHPRERIWIDGDLVNVENMDQTLNKIFNEEKDLAISLTYFEAIIAAALQSFSERQVDLAFVEVGMGGRWDATNATDPILSVITNVGLDHQQYLGDTKELICREKLAIGRSQRPLVLGPTLSRAWVEPLLECVPSVYTTSKLDVPVDILWDYSIVDGKRFGLAGRHQLDNLSCALKVLDCLRGLGFNLPAHECQKSLAYLHWPGRLSSLPGFENVWIDGAHNPEGLEALKAHCSMSNKTPHLYFGVMKDKDLTTMSKILKAFPKKSLTLIQGTAERFATLEALGNLLKGISVDYTNLSSWNDLEGRLKSHQGEPVLIMGSLYLVGEILEHFNLIPNSE